MRIKYCVFLIAFLIVSLTGANLLLAERNNSAYEGKIIPYGSDFQGSSPDKVINVLISEPRWLAYKAFRSNNKSICDSAKGTTGKKDCLELVNYFTAIQSLAKGNCMDIPYSHNEFKEICQALKKRNCALLSGYKKPICEALYSNSINKAKEAFSDNQFPVLIADKQEKAEMLINLYNGFKMGSENSCARFTTNNLLINASCNMLLGNRAFERKLSDIAEDINKAIRAKKFSNKQLCQTINNGSIKSACYDESAIDLYDILRTVWH